MNPLKRLVLFLLACVVVAITLTIASPTTAAVGNTYYVDGATGSDTYPGTLAAPWKTIKKATTSIGSGDTVIIAAGIYRQTDQYLSFVPAGSPGKLTTFKATTGARVIITGITDQRIQVDVGDYVRVQDFWFGGVFDTNDKHGFQMTGETKEIVNCTFFGYPQGPILGWGENILFQGNRLIDNGNGGLQHGVYISSGIAPNGQITNHVIVDNNTVIGRGNGNSAYGIELWHGPRNVIFTRNFIAAHNWGSSNDGVGSLFANNLYWKMTGSTSSTPVVPPWGPLQGTTPNIYYNNVFGPHGWVYFNGLGGPPGKITVANNAFTTDWPLPPNVKPPANTCWNPCGQTGIVLHAGKESAELGISAATMDAAIAALQKSFSQPVAQIYVDKTIEPNLAVLRATVPQQSPLYRKGIAWFGQPINIGPDAPMPATTLAFWTAFRTLGLPESDRFGNPQ